MTLLKLSAKKEKELEGAGEPARVRTIFASESSRWFSE